LLKQTHTGTYLLPIRPQSTRLKDDLLYYWTFSITLYDNLRSASNTLFPLIDKRVTVGFRDGFANKLSLTSIPIPGSNANI